jgi:ABC-type glycerol-3-phosphate transport system substrate-binding protein
MRRKWWSLVIIAMCLLLAVGCSSGSGNTAGNGQEGDSGEGGAAKEQTAETNSAGGDNGEKTEITFLVLTDWEAKLKTAAEEFNKDNPNITVKMEPYPFRQLFETMEVKLGSKSADIDVVLTDGPLVSNYFVKGYLEPLDGLVSEDAKSKWIPSSLDAGTVNGTLAAAPMNTSSQVLYFNKDIFAEKGVTPPDFDVEKRWTWEQVVETGKQLTYDNNGDGQNDIFGFSFEQINRPYQLLALGHSLGAKVISDDGLVSEGFSNSPEMVQAGQFYYDLYNTYKISPNITADQAVEYFATGKVAMFVGGTWNVGRFTEDKVNFGIAPHPYFEGKQVATPTGSWHVGVSRFSEHKAEAAKFVEFLTAGRGAEMWFAANNDLPAHVDLLKKAEEDPKYQEFPQNIMLLAINEASNTAVARPKTPGYLEWETLMDKAFNDIKNGTDPKQALDGAVSQIDRQLKKYADN